MAAPPTTIGEALVTTIGKFRKWVEDVAREQGVSEEHLVLLRTGLDRDINLYVLAIKDFLKTHERALQDKNVAYFQALLPHKFGPLKITPEIADKGFLYVAVFRRLFTELQ